MPRSRILRRVRAYLVGAMLGAIPCAAMAAGGLTLPNQSTKSGGAAFAFGPTDNTDASAAFFNPAGLGGLSGTHMNLGGSILYLDYDIKARGRYNPNQSRDKDIVPGQSPIRGNTLAAVPDVYYSHPISDNLTFGVGLNAPIGFIQALPKNSSARYQGNDAYIITQNLGPALGWRVTDNFSVGAGLNIQYFFLKISNEVDTGTRLETQFDTDCPRIVNSTGSAALGGILSNLGLGNLVDGLIGGLPAADVVCGSTNSPGLIEPRGLAGDFDFSNDFKVDDIGFGYNLGFQWQMTPQTRLGVHYRSKIDHTLRGKADRERGSDLEYARKIEDPQQSDSTGVQALLAAREAASLNTAGDTYESLSTLKALQNSSDQNVRVNVTTPESISAGLVHTFTPRLTVALNYEWTRWSRFDELRFHYTGKPQFYDDVFQQLIGRKLRPSERVDRRDNPTVQPLNFEDAARYGVGANYYWTPKLQLRAGMAYTEAVVNSNTVTDRLRTPSGPTAYFTTGATYQWNTHLAIDFSLGYSRIFTGKIRQVNVASRTLNQLNGEFSDVSIYATGLTLRWSMGASDKDDDANASSNQGCKSSACRATPRH